MKLYTAWMITCDVQNCVKELKIPCHWGRWREHKFQEAERRAERDSNILFYNPWVFDIFVLLPAIIMQYLYDSI